MRVVLNTVAKTGTQRLAKSEIDEVTRKINSLSFIHSQLEQDLLKIQEEELELEDECALFHVFHALFSSCISAGSSREKRI